MSLEAEAVAFLQTSLQELADPAKAGPMAAYLKTDMPFYGIQTPARKPVQTALAKRFPPPDQDAYERVVLALWALPHREEKYVALNYATRHRAFVQPASVDLYQRLITEGAWWDLVDALVPNLGPPLHDTHPAFMTARVRAWAEHPDVWLRRSALLSQLKRRDRTDEALLFELCARLAPDETFWVRKALGWALRTHARRAPDAVTAFLVRHRSALSRLSFREAAKHLELS